MRDTAVIGLLGLTALSTSVTIAPAWWTKAFIGGWSCQFVGKRFFYVPNQKNVAHE